MKTFCRSRKSLATIKTMKTNDEKELTFVGHLAEFRKHLIVSIIVFFVVTLVTFNFADELVVDMVNKAENTQFVYLSPAELFTSYIKIAMVMGLVVSLPFLLNRLWVFVRPGLFDHERKAIRNALFMGLGLFLVGMVFAYEIVLPMSLKFFAGFQMPEVQSAVGFANYFDYVMGLVFAFGLVFELPILVVLLITIGVFETEFLKKNRKIVLLLVVIVAAIITPPDVISQILLAVPMMLLFELGIVLGKKVEERRERKKLEQDTAE